MRNPIRVLTESPDYILGRFQSMRSAYALARRTSQLWSGAPLSIKISDRYGDAARARPLVRSGLVSTALPTVQHTGNLTRDAFSPGLRLTSSATESLLAASRELPLHGDDPRNEHTFSELMSSATLRADVAVATVSGAARIDAIQAIAADPVVVDVVAAYLRYVPTRVSSWMFWSPHNSLADREREARYQTVRFHYDVHGYNFLYVNFYLVDTTVRNGAHVLIKGSHRNKRARHLIGSAKLGDAEAIRDYGESRICPIEGAAGDGFFEDTACYHKALAPLERERLMLQLRYQ